MTTCAGFRTTLALAACATPYNSGISEKAADTYFLQIRTPNKDGGSEESLRKAKVQADEFCAKSGKKSEITSQELGPVTADVFFTCGGCSPISGTTSGSTASPYAEDTRWTRSGSSSAWCTTSRSSRVTEICNEESKKGEKPRASEEQKDEFRSTLNSSNQEIHSATAPAGVCGGRGSCEKR